MFNNWNILGSASIDKRKQKVKSILSPFFGVRVLSKKLYNIRSPEVMCVVMLISSTNTWFKTEWESEINFYPNFYSTNQL